MKYSHPLILVSCLASSTFAWSEISSLTQEELTDTYIKDTTVIVRPKKDEAVNDEVRVSLKVSPIEQATQLLPQTDEQTISAINPALNSYTELNEQAQLSTNLAPQVPQPSTTFLRPAPQEDALALIRSAYGIDAGDPVDLTTLNFNNEFPATYGLQTQNLNDPSISATGNSFTLRIPNVGNINSQNFATPNGEVGVNITPNNIEYTINLPN